MIPYFFKEFMDPEVHNKLDITYFKIRVILSFVVKK